MNNRFLDKLGMTGITGNKKAVCGGVAVAYHPLPTNGAVIPTGESEWNGGICRQTQKKTELK
ncbi:MAG: hypothetical protein LBS42_11010 [Tannerella sp.]|jgi:hypothetical protein|nr:hypothetical protein [Tannerella sp.]